MAIATTEYKYCFDGTTLSQKIDNEWSYVMPYIKQKYTNSTTAIGQAVLVIQADMASFRVNHPHAFDLTAGVQERNSFGLSLAIVVDRLLTTTGVLKTLLPAETDDTDTPEDANIRYSLDVMRASLTQLQTSLPVPCP